MRVEEGFQQTPPEELHPYSSDPVLPSLLRRVFPERYHATIEADLLRFGERVTTEIRSISARVYPPTLTQYDHWGRRVDELHTSEAWRQLKAIAQEEGLVGICYERDYEEHSRVFAFAKIVMMVGDAQVVFCPLSMTDGCARVMELMGTTEMKSEIYPRLISRDPHEAFTAGQWMTERPGGSDVSQTETTATPAAGTSAFVATPGSEYILDGFKWFSSATDSNVALALARTGSPSSGSRGLSLFLIPLRSPLLTASPFDTSAAHPPSISNGIYVHRLKDKIGTQIVPTAELELRGTRAQLISPLGGGVKAITPVLNITRLHCASDSLGCLRRCYALARAYAHVREVGGNGARSTLRDVPLHTAVLARVGVLYRALAQLFFGVVLLVGKGECGVISTEERGRLRLLTPALKAFAAEKASAAMEECMAALGGQGYMEETGIGRMIRDSLVEKIWEGTVNVLSLDLVRAARDPSAVQAYMKWADAVIDAVPQTLRQQLNQPLTSLRSGLDKICSPGILTQPIPTLMPRPALILFAHVTAALYLLEHASWSYQHHDNESEHDVDAEVFNRWVEEFGLSTAVEDVERAKEAGKDRLVLDEAIVYGTAAAAAGKARL